MKSISFEANDGIFEGLIKVMVYDTEHLDALTKQFQQIDGVERIERWDVEENEIINVKE
jgi:GTP pyrophosphokinase